MRAIDKVDPAWLAQLFDAARGRPRAQWLQLQAGSPRRALLRRRDAARQRRQRARDVGRAGHPRVLGGQLRARAVLATRHEACVHLPIDYYAQAGRWDLDPMAFGGNPRMTSSSIRIASRVTATSRRSGSTIRCRAVIGCERCHGPSKKHIDTLKHEDTVGPKRLSPRGASSRCARECHQSTFRDAAAGPRSLRLSPRRALDAFRVNFLAEPAEPDRVKLLAHAERPRAQRVLARRTDKLTCTTCHDPHVSSIDEPRVVVGRPCLQCHDPKRCTDTRRASRGRRRSLRALSHAARPRPRTSRSSRSPITGSRSSRRRSTRSSSRSRTRSCRGRRRSASP